MLNVNFLSGKLGWRIKRADHEGNLKKALGKTKERLNIFDATAGLLSDSMIFLSLGHNVVAVEQSKIIYLLVNDAIHRARNRIPFLKNLKFIHDNSIVSYKKSKKSFDIIYLDPMYPVTKKKIKKSGDLRSIGSILELENLFDKGDYLIDKFMKVDCKKLILKRPLKSEKIYSNINYQVKGKTTRFDIYL
jgi:16S rRNA (guanine1516-N2)-methyltransferase